MKRGVALFITVAVVVSIFVTGCTSNTTNQSSNESTLQTALVKQNASTGNHNKTLQAVIDDDKQAYINATWTLAVNNSIQWINDTAALVTFKIGYANSSTLQYTARYLKFSGDTEASNFVNSTNRGFNQASAILLKNDVGLTTVTSNNHQNYKKITNRVPTVSVYESMRDAGSTYQGSYILRINEVVTTFNATVKKSVASPKPTQSTAA